MDIIEARSAYLTPSSQLFVRLRYVLNAHLRPDILPHEEVRVLLHGREGAPAMPISPDGGLEDKEAQSVQIVMVGLSEYSRPIRRQHITMMSRSIVR